MRRRPVIGERRALRVVYACGHLDAITFSRPPSAERLAALKAQGCLACRARCYPVPPNAAGVPRFAKADDPPLPPASGDWTADTAMVCGGMRDGRICAGWFAAGAGRWGPGLDGKITLLCPVCAGERRFANCDGCGAEIESAPRWTIGNPQEGGRVLCQECVKREAQEVWVAAGGQLAWDPYACGAPDVGEAQLKW